MESVKTEEFDIGALSFFAESLDIETTSDTGDFFNVGWIESRKSQFNVVGLMFISKYIRDTRMAFTYQIFLRIE